MRRVSIEIRLKHWDGITINSYPYSAEIYLDQFIYSVFTMVDAGMANHKRKEDFFKVV